MVLMLKQKKERKNIRSLMSELGRVQNEGKLYQNLIDKRRIKNNGKPSLMIY